MSAAAASQRMVFLSHAWESTPAENRKHEEEVVSLAALLHENGCRVRLDLMEQEAIRRLGLARWMSQAMDESDKVLILCTPTYKAKATVPRPNEPIRSGAGVKYETYLMEGEIAKQGGCNTKFVPLILKRLGGGREHIPFKALEQTISVNVPNDNDPNELIRAVYERERYAFAGPPGPVPQDLTQAVSSVAALASDASASGVMEEKAAAQPPLSEAWAAQHRHEDQHLRTTHALRGDSNTFYGPVVFGNMGGSSSAVGPSNEPVVAHSLVGNKNKFGKSVVFGNKTSP